MTLTEGTTVPVEVLCTDTAPTLLAASNPETPVFNHSISASLAIMGSLKHDTCAVHSTQMLSFPPLYLI